MQLDITGKHTYLLIVTFNIFQGNMQDTIHSNVLTTNVACIFMFTAMKPPT